jgi:hypothetical protein
VHTQGSLGLVPPPGFGGGKVPVQGAPRGGVGELGSSVLSRAGPAAGETAQDGDSYFVEDGNHRVSVAHYQEVEMIKAEVTEFFPL